MKPHWIKTTASSYEYAYFRNDSKFSNNPCPNFLTDYWNDIKANYINRSLDLKMLLSGNSLKIPFPDEWIPTFLPEYNSQKAPKLTLKLAAKDIAAEIAVEEMEKKRVEEEWDRIWDTLKKFSFIFVRINLLHENTLLLPITFFSMDEI